MQSELAGITGAMSDMMTKMGGINGNMTAALGFANIKLNVFGCELNPTAGMSDYYTLDMMLNTTIVIYFSELIGFLYSSRITV